MTETMKDRNKRRLKQLEIQHKITTTVEKVLDSKVFKDAINPSWWSKLWR